MFGGERSPDIKNPPTSLVDRHNGVRVSSRTEIRMGVMFRHPGRCCGSTLVTRCKDPLHTMHEATCEGTWRGHTPMHNAGFLHVSGVLSNKKKGKGPYLWCHSLAVAHYAHRIAHVRRAMYVSWVGQVNHQGGCFAHLLSNTRASSVWNCLSPRQLGLCFGLRCCGGVSRGRVTPCAVA